MPNTYATARTLAVHSHGHTVATDTLTAPASGYAVGCPEWSLRLTGPVRTSGILAWLNRLPLDRVKHVGIWQDTDTGITYLDVVDVFTNPLAARRACLDRGELAYYSLHEGREYRV